MKAEHNVLLDMSYASLGYCGIAQESRVLLKALYRHPRIKPTGLVFGHGDAVINHRFAPSPRLARRMENQALFVQSLVDGRPPGPAFAPTRALHRLRRMWRLALSRRIQTDPLDSEVFWDAVWRRLLAPSLSDCDIEMARRCPMALANLGGMMLTIRSLYNLPSVRLNTKGYDFALFHNSQPIKVGPNTCKLIRYYDMIPGVRPDLVGSQLDVANHFRAIRRCLNDSIFVCDSGPARADLVRAFPELEERSVVIPDGLPDGYYPEDFPERLGAIVRSRRAQNDGQSGPPPPEFPEIPPYLLMTSTIEPRKNHITLVRAFENLLSRRPSDLRLIVVGRPGWKYTEAMRAMKPLIEQQRIIHLVDVPISEMRILNSHAEAMVFPSLYEGFGYGPLEAMSCHTPAVVSDIAAHRWTYGEAATYFDPYRVDSLVDALERVLFSDSNDFRHQLVQAGAQRVKRYSSDAVGKQWAALFDELLRQKIKGNASEARLAHFS